MAQTQWNKIVDDDYLRTSCERVSRSVGRVAACAGRDAEQKLRAYRLAVESALRSQERCCTAATTVLPYHGGLLEGFVCVWNAAHQWGKRFEDIDVHLYNKYPK